MKKVKWFLIVLISLLVISGIKKNNNIFDDFTIKAATEVKDQREFKAVWISPFIGELPYSSELEFKTYMNQVFEMLEHYGYNALIFHVRTHNNALYKSELNPKASWFSLVDFDEFDPLEWVIEQAHLRGIELHAWLNPYRIGGHYVGAMPSVNPESDPNNLIDNKILNPALEVVRTHIYNTILEIVEQYDVDAIHFDDYFYVQTNAYPTQANQRREQVDLLIEGISNTLKTFNEANNRYVQFGISPTGIYKNGNGVVNYDSNGNPITTGSNTRGFEHFGEYLYSDTVKWAVNGWIDYLVPQTYWARDNNAASFTLLTDWWDKVFKNLQANLYLGIGVYMADEPRDTFGWQSDVFEMDAQLEIVEQLNNVSGYVLFSFKHLKNGYDDVQIKSGQQVRNAYLNEERKKIKVLPEIKSMEAVIPDAVCNIGHNNGVLNWHGVNNAKFYYIYRSEAELTYSSDEIIGVIGHQENNNFTTNDYEKNYNYGIRALSATNHLSPLKDIEQVESFNINYYLNDGQFLLDGYQEVDVMIADFLQDYYNFLIDSRHLSIDILLSDFMHGINQTSGYDGLYNDENYFSYLYSPNSKEVNNNSQYFINQSLYNKWVLLLDTIDKYTTIINPTQTFWGSKYTGRVRIKEFFTKKDYNNDAVRILLNEVPDGYKPKKPVVYSYNEFSLPLLLPEAKKEGYEFGGWYDNSSLAGTQVETILKGAEGDKTYYAKWIKAYEYVTVNFNLNDGSTTVNPQTIIKNTKISKPSNPQRDGYEFLGWYLGDDLFNFNNVINQDITLDAKWDLKKVTVDFNLNYSQGINPVSQTLGVGQTVQEPTINNREGYEFLGWYLNNELFDFNTPILKNITLVAKWKEITVYNVYFDLNYETQEPPLLVNVNKGQTVTKPLDPVRNNYLFMGWYLDDVMYNFNTPITADINLVAHWLLDEDKEFMQVAFDCVIEGLSLDDMIVEKGLTITKPNNPTAKEYDFFGWCLNGKLFNFNEPITEDITLIAQWELKVLEVTFIGFNNSVIDQYEVDYGTIINPPELELVEGYKFIGWYLDFNLFDFNSIVTENLTIYAHYEAEQTNNYNITFYVGNNSYTTQIIEQNNYALKPLDPVKENHIFAGWIHNDKLYNFDQPVTENINLHASWIKVATSNEIESLGASIRDTDGTTEQGLRFQAKINNISENKINHGFYLVFGEVEVNDFIQLLINDYNNLVVNGKNVFDVKINNYTNNNVYSVILTGIPLNGYLDKITAIPYIRYENQILLADQLITRAVAGVAFSLCQIGYDYSHILQAVNSNIKKWVKVDEHNFKFIDSSFYMDSYLDFKYEFIKDWNEMFLLNWTELDSIFFYQSAIEGSLNINRPHVNKDLSTTNIYKFFNHPIYKTKWDWLLDYIMWVNIEKTHPTRQIKAIRADGTNNENDGWSNRGILYNANHLIYSLYNFFTFSSIDNMYPSLHFTDINLYEEVKNFNDQILINDLNNLICESGTFYLPEITLIPPENHLYVYSDGSNYYYPNEGILITENKSFEIILISL